MTTRTRKLAVFNNKGGVGKSTIAVHIAYGLARRGERVLLLDMDEQNDASLFLGFTSEDYNKTLYDIIVQGETALVRDCIFKARENLDLLPSKHISHINEMLYKEKDITSYLKIKLEDLEEMGYSYVIIDCGPQRSKINDAILYYADGIIVPVQVEAASVRALGNIYEYLYELGLDSSMIKQVIPNMYDKRTSDGKENLDFIKEFLDGQDILTEPVCRRIKISEAGKMGRTVYEFDKTSTEQFEHIIQRLVLIDGKEK